MTQHKISISAWGQTPFTTSSTKATIPAAAAATATDQIKDLMFDSIKALFENNSNIEKNDIDTVLVSTNNNTKYLGAIISEMIDIKPKISHNIESMCSSGTNALVSAYSYIASGLSKAALVVGADTFDGPGQILEWDQTRGQFTHPIFWASLFCKAYKTAFGIHQQDIATIAAKNHKNAIDNPNAIPRQGAIPSTADILDSKKLTDDLHILECSRPSTGAAAVLVTSNEMTSKITDTPIWISGIGQKTTAASFTKSTDSYTKMHSTADAAKQAFSMAKITPTQVDVAEVHDAFAVCEALAVEDIGFIKKGKGAQFCNQLYKTQDRKINPRGGLIGSGHPLGATGIAQTIEIMQQLQNNAKKRQVPNPRVGLVHNMSAAATSSTVLVMTN